MKTAFFKVDRDTQGVIFARVNGVVNYKEQQDILLSLTSLAEFCKTVRQPAPTTNRINDDELDLGVFVQCTLDDIQRIFDLVNLSLKTQDLRPAEAPKPVVAADGSGTVIQAPPQGEKISILNNMTGEKLQLYIEDSQVEIFKKNSDVTIFSDTSPLSQVLTSDQKAFSLDDSPTLHGSKGVRSLLDDYASGNQPIIFRFDLLENSSLRMDVIGLSSVQAQSTIDAYKTFQKQNAFDPMNVLEEAVYDQAVLQMQFSLKTDATYFLFKNMRIFFTKVPTPVIAPKPCFKLNYVENDLQEGELTVSTLDHSRLDPAWIFDHLRSLDARLTQADRALSQCSAVKTLPNIARLEIHSEALGVTGRIPLVRPIISAIFRNQRIEISNDSKTYNALVKAGLVRPTRKPPEFGFSNGKDGDAPLA